MGIIFFLSFIVQHFPISIVQTYQFEATYALYVLEIMVNSGISYGCEYSQFNTTDMLPAQYYDI